ncbi:hypothetical protein ACT691_07340 [Vibrio metschnikovii]
MQDPSVILPALTGHLDNFVSQQFAQDYPFIQYEWMKKWLARLAYAR